MNKSEFLAQLNCRIQGIPKDDAERFIEYYSEMIDDRVEDGLSEEDAVEAIGTIEDITAQILEEIPLKKLVKEKIKPNRALRTWEIVLLVLGFPVWLPLLLAAFVIVLAVCIVLWSVIISLYAVDVSLVGCAVGGILTAGIFISQGNVPSGIAMFGMCVFCAGLSIFMFFGCKAATKGVLVLTKKTVLGIKTLFVGKESAK